MAGIDEMNRLPDTVIREVSSSLFAAGEMIAADMHVSITSGSASGQSGGKHQHQRSRPGEAPNNEFGDLVRSIEVTRQAVLRVNVEVGAAHAAPLEYGTSRMAARPFVRPARDRNKRTAQELVRDAVNRALRKTFRR